MEFGFSPTILIMEKIFILLSFCVYKKMVFITQCDSPALWQTYLSDPASITMEGILIFNKHLLFLLTVIVLFIG
jgi:hypothetical protein